MPRTEAEANDKKASYGNWAVFAVANLSVASSAMEALSPESLDNLVLVNHGGTHGKESLFAFSDKTTVDKESDVISTSEIKGYNDKGGKGLTPGESDVKYLKSLGDKVADGGNFVYAFCYTGRGAGGIETINELSRLQNDRLNTFLPIGYAATKYYKYSTGRAINVNASLSGSKPGGWLYKNGAGNPLKIWDVVMSSSSTPIRTVARKPSN